MLVGLIGHKGVGRATVAQLFKNEGYTVLNFSDPLLDAASVLLGIPMSWLRNATEAEKSQVVPGFEVTYSDFIHDLKTDVATNNGGDFFTRRFDVEMVQYQGQHVVVSDVTYGNEAAHILSKQGILIRVDRVTSDFEKHANKKVLEIFSNYDRTTGYKKAIRSIDKSLQQAYVLDNTGSIDKTKSNIEGILRKAFY